MKTCKQCKKSKPVTEFYEQQQRGDNGQVWRYYDCYCKVCRLEYGSERRRKIKRQAVDYLGGACKRCGLRTERVEVYDFHHKDPNAKDFAIGRQTKAFDSIRAELDKCDLLCANCHRIEHGF